METTSEPLLLTRKDVLTVLPGRSERFVTDMKRAGFRLPATIAEVNRFIRRHPHPSGLRARQIRKTCHSRIGT